MINRRGGIFSLAIIFLVVVGIIIGYFLFSPDAPEVDGEDVIGKVGGALDRGQQQEEEQTITIEGTSDSEKLSSGATAVWKNTPLVDVTSGESFKISDFEGTPVLLESFAVWCPKCTQQQNNLVAFHESVGDSVISISLNTDPSEDAERVRNHVADNGYTWRYAVAPESMTEALVDEFGTGIISAPSVPMILICSDGSYRKLGGIGARSAEKLEAEVADGC